MTMKDVFFSNEIGAIHYNRLLMLISDKWSFNATPLFVSVILKSTNQQSSNTFFAIHETNRYNTMFVIQIKNSMNEVEGAIKLTTIRVLQKYVYMFLI